MLSFIDSKVPLHNHLLRQVMFARTRMMRTYPKRKERKSRDDCKKAGNNVEKPVIGNGLETASTPRTNQRRSEGKEKKDKTSTS